MGNASRVIKEEQMIDLNKKHIWPKTFKPIIKEINLSTRASNCLACAGLWTLAEVITTSDEELLKIKNLGKFTLKEIRRKIPFDALFSKSKKSSVDTTKIRNKMQPITTFYDIMHKVKTISESSPYWKHLKPGTILEFKNSNDAQIAIDKGYASEI